MVVAVRPDRKAPAQQIANGLGRKIWLDVRRVLSGGQTNNSGEPSDDGAVTVTDIPEFCLEIRGLASECGELPPQLLASFFRNRSQATQNQTHYIVVSQTATIEKCSVEEKRGGNAPSRQD